MAMTRPRHSIVGWVIDRLEDDCLGLARLWQSPCLCRPDVPICGTLVGGHPTGAGTPSPLAITRSARSRRREPAFGAGELAVGNHDTVRRWEFWELFDGTDRTPIPDNRPEARDEAVAEGFVFRGWSTVAMGYNDAIASVVPAPRLGRGQADAP